MYFRVFRLTKKGDFMQSDHYPDYPIELTITYNPDTKHVDVNVKDYAKRLDIITIFQSCINIYFADILRDPRELSDIKPHDLLNMIVFALESTLTRDLKKALGKGITSTEGHHGK